MQACILLSLLWRILVVGVSGLVPRLVVTTITGMEAGSLATNATVLTGAQSWFEQQSASYQECVLAGLDRAAAIRSAQATPAKREPDKRLRAGWRILMGASRQRSLLHHCEQGATPEALPSLCEG